MPDGTADWPTDTETDTDTGWSPDTDTDTDADTADGALGRRRFGAGPRVVLVHGFTQTGRSWQPIIDRLSDTYEVVTVDAPGHGASGLVRADLPTAAPILAAAGARAAYVGYSMGARLCLHLALARPDLVRRLVLVGATAGLDDPQERGARRAADDVLAERLEAGGDTGLEGFLERWLAGPLFATLSPALAGLPARRENTPAGLASSLRLAGTGAQEPLWDRLEAVTMPVLVVAGEHDEKFADLGRRLVGAIGANARLALIPDAGHAAHLEQPDAFTAAVAPFLRGPSTGDNRDEADPSGGAPFLSGPSAGDEADAADPEE